MHSKRGQGLSLNVIIVAALALIVLVVLVVVFTGRIGIFERGVSQESNAELIKLKTGYGDCHPTGTQEADFRAEFGRAESPQDEDAARSRLRESVDTCKPLVDKDTCESGGCSWR